MRRERSLSGSKKKPSWIRIIKFSQITFVFPVYPLRIIGPEYLLTTPEEKVMKVREIMTEPVIVIKEDQTLEEAARLMLDKNIGGLPVVDGDGTLVGVITESDFAAKEHAIPFSRIYAPQLFGKWMSKEGVEKAYEAARRIKVREIMTTAVVTVEEDDFVAEAINRMLDHHVHRLPVVRDGTPVGMISRHDLLKLIVNRLEV